MPNAADQQVPSIAEAFEAFGALTAEERLELSRTVPLVVTFQEFPDIAIIAGSGITLPPHQRTAISLSTRPVGHNVTVASRGTAKCLGWGTEVLMADGTLRAVQGVQVGDQVMGPDSRPRRVLHTMRGTGPLYRVNQTSAMPYVVNEAHILTLRKARAVLSRAGGVFAQWPDELVDLPVREFAALRPWVQEHLRGYRAGLVKFPTRKVPLDPYFFGVWLGDGSGNNRVVAVTTMDPEVVAACETVIAAVPGGHVRSYLKPGSRAQSLFLVSGGTRGKPNLLLEVLRGMGVMSPPGRGSVNKHIPHAYIANSEAVRLGLLAGLVDSDGTKDSGCYKIVQKSERLARDIKHLADTLGFRTSLKPKQATCGNNGKVSLVWQVMVCGDLWRIPCRVARKVIRKADLHKNKNWLLSQVSVAACGAGPWAGFAVDGDCRYLLADGTVTHNSSTVCVLSANVNALMNARRDGIVISSTGFRGGQQIFSDADKWLRNGWDSQLADISFFRASIPRPNVLTRAQNYWRIEYDSFSGLITLPTKDPDSIRGTRGRDLYVDEANTINRDLIDRVALPFLNVKGDFEHGGAFSAQNKVYFCSTIDFSWRPFLDRVRAARAGLERDHAAWRAMRAGNWPLYDDLDVQGIHQHTLLQLDYTDTLIPETLVARDGRRFGVRWPNPKIPLTRDRKGIPFSVRLPDGRMQKEGVATAYYQTYPVDKETLERALLDGSSDESAWLAEQRNIVDQAIGDVYAHELVDRAACVGDHYVAPYKHMPEAWRRVRAEGEDDYVSPILWRCTDPCVLGVDYAPQSDYCAFVVIRMGPLAKGEFDPFTHHGRTPWSNVVWAEQWLRLSGRDGAEVVFKLAERYNLHYIWDGVRRDSWEMCRAVGLDMRGGGSAVRDELCFINDERPREGLFRMYDPLDQDERIRQFERDGAARPMLDGIWPTDQLNDRLVEFSVGQMQNGLLFLPKFLDVSQRPAGQRELWQGYEAGRTLAWQLRKLRQEPQAKGAYRHFFMEGSSAQAQNKKDLWAAFIYAAKQLRAHLIRQKQMETVVAPMAASVTRIGSGKGGWYGRRSAGSKL